jgi:hypothetical protein
MTGLNEVAFIQIMNDAAAEEKTHSSQSIAIDETC